MKAKTKFLNSSAFALSCRNRILNTVPSLVLIGTIWSQIFIFSWYQFISIKLDLSMENHRSQENKS